MVAAPTRRGSILSGVCCTRIAFFPHTLHANRLRGQPFLDEQTRAGDFFLAGLGRRLTWLLCSFDGPCKNAQRAEGADSVIARKQPQPPCRFVAIGATQVVD